MAEVTWLGDEDASVQQIQQYDHTFVKGVPTKVDAKDPKMAKFKDNQFFHVKGDDKGAPEVVESEEPEQADPDEGSEKAAARLALKEAGLSWHPKSDLAHLRKQLADHLAKAEPAKDA